MVNGHVLTPAAADHARYPIKEATHVRLGRDLKVLQVLLPVEGDVGRLDLALLDVDLVAAEDDGDVFAHTLEVAVPVGHVLVRDARRHVEHDDAALALDVVAVAQAAKLLLAGRVPHIEADRAKVGVEGEGVDLDAEGGYLVSSGDREHGLGSGKSRADDRMRRGHWGSGTRMKLGLSGKGRDAPMYFFSNSPVKWRLTKVVCPSASASVRQKVDDQLTLPV